ncbi:MAG: hypothetical protein SVY53_02395, partial [Chloroflexota bacterium]|nr:hypothetical protein [Chloroflexota bacterium]
LNTDGSTGEVSQESGISLVQPVFADNGTGAFPEDEAGFTAYLNAGQAIDLEEIGTCFSTIKEIGDNYIIGVVPPISNYGGNEEVTVYADTDGWIAAYLRNDEPDAKIMRWDANNSGGVHNPNITEITTTTLKDALYVAGEAASIPESTLEEMKYYHFEYPEADSMTLFVRTMETEGTNMVHLKIPVSYTLYEASYYHYAYDASSSVLKVDGETVDELATADRQWGRTFGSYGEHITPGEIHKMEISYAPAPNFDDGSAGVATVLIYQGS